MKVFEYLSKEVDLKWVFIDGNYVKAYQHSCNISHKE